MAQEVVTADQLLSGLEKLHRLNFAAQVSTDEEQLRNFGGAELQGVRYDFQMHVGSSDLVRYTGKLGQGNRSDLIDQGNDGEQLRLVNDMDFGVSFEEREIAALSEASSASIFNSTDTKKLLRSHPGYGHFVLGHNLFSSESLLDELNALPPSALILNGPSDSQRSGMFELRADLQGGHITVYFDPNHELAYSGLEIEKSNTSFPGLAKDFNLASIKCIVSNVRHENIDNMWFPVEADLQMEVTRPNGDTRESIIHAAYDSVEIRENIPAAEFHVLFPAGSKIFDARLSTTYIADSAGEPMPNSGDLEKIASIYDSVYQSATSDNSEAPTGSAAEGIPTEESIQQYIESWRVIGISALCIMALISILVIARFRRRTNPSSNLE